jgi:hypothetical protein
MSKRQQVRQYPNSTSIQYVLHVAAMEDQLVYEQHQTVTLHLVYALWNRKQDMIACVPGM